VAAPASLHRSPRPATASNSSTVANRPASTWARAAVTMARPMGCSLPPSQQGHSSDRSLTYLQGECSYRCAEEEEEEEEIQRRPSACSQYPPAHTDTRRRRGTLNAGRLVVLNDPPTSALPASHSRCWMDSAPSARTAVTAGSPRVSVLTGGSLRTDPI